MGRFKGLNRRTLVNLTKKLEDVPLQSRLVEFERDTLASLGKLANVFNAVESVGMEYDANYEYVRVSQKSSTDLCDRLQAENVDPRSLRAPEYLEFQALKAEMGWKHVTYESFAAFSSLEEEKQMLIDKGNLKGKKSKAKRERRINVAEFATEGGTKKGTIRYTAEAWHKARKQGLAKVASKKIPKINTPKASKVKGVKALRATRWSCLEDTLPGFVDLHSYAKNVGRYLSGKDPKYDLEWAKGAIMRAQKKNSKNMEAIV